MSTPRILIGSFPPAAGFAAWITDRLRHYIGTAEVGQLPPQLPSRGVSHVVFILGPSWPTHIRHPQAIATLQAIIRQASAGQLRLVLPLMEGSPPVTAASLPVELGALVHFDTIPFEGRSYLSDYLGAGLTLIDTLAGAMEDKQRRQGCLDPQTSSQLEQVLNHLNWVRDLVSAYHQENPSILALVTAIVGKRPLQQLWEQIDRAGAIYGIVQTVRHVVSVLAQRSGCLSRQEQQAINDQVNQLQQWYDDRNSRQIAAHQASPPFASLQQSPPGQTGASRKWMRGGCGVLVAVGVLIASVLLLTQNGGDGSDSVPTTAAPVEAWYLCPVNLSDNRQDSLFWALEYDQLEAVTEPRPVNRPTLSTGQSAYFDPGAALDAFCQSPDPEFCDEFVRVLYTEAEAERLAILVGNQLESVLGQRNIALEVERVETPVLFRLIESGGGFLYVWPSPCLE